MVYRRNYVSVLPQRLPDCTTLTEIRASSNQLLRLPPSIGALAELKLLDVHHNILQSLPDSLAFLSALTRLRVSGNRLTDVPDAFFYMPYLATLELDHNALTVLPGNRLPFWFLGHGGSAAMAACAMCFFFECVSVWSVDGSDGAVRAGSLCELTALTTLLLAHNKLQQLPLQVGRLHSLATLTIDSNALARLPLSLRNLTQLTKFDASDNPDIDLPPPAVTSKGSWPPPESSLRPTALACAVSREMYRGLSS